MIRRMLLALVAVLMLAAPATAAPEGWDRTGKEVRAQAEAVRKDAREQKAEVAREKKDVQAEIRRLRTRAKKAEAELEGLKERFEGLREQEETARRELADQEQDLALIETAALDAARDAEHIFLVSPCAVLAPDRLEAARAMLDGEGLPAFEQIRALGEGLLAEAADTGLIRVVRSGFLGPAGSSVEGEVLLAGGNCAYYRNGDSVGGLTLVEGPRLSASNAVFDSSVEDAVAAAFAGDSAPPLDLSAGKYFDAPPASASLWQRVGQGGFLVWPILAVGLAGLLIGLERLAVLARIRGATGAEPEELAPLVLRGNRDECLRLCDGSGDSPACRVLAAGVGHADATREVLENVFHDAILKEVPRLERFLPTLAVLGAVAPLLGLLGTVTGMINTFDIMSLFGNTDAKLMSGGISEALITTQLGLAVAIPILLLHHFLERRVDAIVGDMEEKSVAFAVALMQEGGERP
jgi:biopolymer transport protein ExbB